MDFSPAFKLALFSLFVCGSQALVHSGEWMNGKSAVPSQVEKFVSSPGAALDIKSDSFCKAAGIRCSDVSLAACTGKPYRRLLDAQLDGSIVCVPHKAPDNAITSRRFFRLSELAKGSTITFPDMVDAAETRFLPHDVAMQLPFSSEDIPEIITALHIQQAPTMKLFMVSTHSACSHAPSAIEVKSCARSLKEMSSFVSTSLQLDSESPAVYSSKGIEKLANKAVKVVEITELIPKSMSHAACHRVAYPYLVHYCHTVKGTEVFSAKLEVGDGEYATALLECHTNTSYMKSSNAILTQLKLNPGEGEFCHFVESTAMIFTKQ